MIQQLPLLHVYLLLISGPDQTVLFSVMENIIDCDQMNASLGGSIGCLYDWRLRVHPHQAHSFMVSDHEIFSMVILSLPLI